MKKEENKLAIYQAPDGAIELRKDNKQETIWATQADLVVLYQKDQSVISRHIKNIFKDGEVDKKSNMQKMHIANSDKPVEMYSLDIILAVGYRTNSSQAIEFRKWATKILKEHITKGFTINPKQIEKNYQHFLQTVEDIKLLAKENSALATDDVLELIQTFSYTWFSLDAYDKDQFPKTGNTAKNISVTAEELYANIEKLKKELIGKKEATKLFAQEKKEGNLEGILGNIFQSVFGEDAYPNVEEKAAHFLYFIIKNHPFDDGNKRTGAFCFLWFLQKTGYAFQQKITPETLTALTLLIAESNPKEKERMVGLILLLLNR